MSAWLLKLTDWIGLTWPGQYINTYTDVDGNPVVGCRKAGTSGWTSAYVTGMRNNVVYAAFFDSGRDFIADGAQTWRQALDAYETMISVGWVPMTESDIQQTAGIKMINV